VNLGSEHALANNDDESDDESDDDLPSLEELLRTPPRPTISDKASRTEPASQHLDQPMLNGVATQADRTKSRIDERQGDSSGRRGVLNAKKRPANDTQINR
jgi:hypothetical protein